MTVCRSDQERKHLIGQRRPDYSMEYYSPEYFLEPAVARTLHKPLLSSITIFSSNDVIQVSTAPLQEIQNPSHKLRTGKGHQLAYTALDCTTTSVL